MSLRVVMVIMFMVLCVEFPRNVGATGKNDDSYDNNLGLLAQVCASNYCNSATNALDLWISVEEVCNANSQPYFREFSSFPSTEARRVEYALSWSIATTAILCVIISTVLLLMGYRGGAKIGSYYRTYYPIV